MKTKRKKLKPYKRMIHLPDGVWSYCIINTFVKIRPPNLDKTFRTDLYAIVGTTFEKWVAENWSGEPTSMDIAWAPNVTPHDIKNYIQERLK